MARPKGSYLFIYFNGLIKNDVALFLSDYQRFSSGLVAPG